MDRNILFKYLKNSRIRYVINSILAKISEIIRPIRILNYPNKIQVESTNVCNLKCIECSRTNEGILNKKLKNIGHLTFENFKHIIDQMPFIDELILQGLGEPFLNKDIFKIIYYAKFIKKILLVHITTNGIPLNKERIRKLFLTNLDSLIFSINTLDPEKYKRISGSQYLQEIIKNLGIVIKFKNDLRSKMRVGITTVILNDNLDELPEIIKFAKTFNVSEVYFTDANLKFDIKNEIKIRDLKRLQISSKKAIKMLNYKITPLKEAMATTVEWYIDYIEANNKKNKKKNKKEKQSMTEKEDKQMKEVIA